MYMGQPGVKIVSSQRGFSLMGVIIAAGIMGTISVYLMDQILAANRAQLSIEKRFEITTIKQRLLFEIDCAKTVAPLNPPADCNPGGGSPTYIRLKDKSDNNIENAAGTSAFINSYQLEGNWYVRTTCDTVTGTPTLKVQLAAQGASAAAFAKDPQTGNNFDWTNPRGTAFGPNGTPICSVELGAGGGGGGGGGAWITGDLAASGKCQSNMMYDDDGNDDYNRSMYVGTVNCPPGQFATGGSVDCGTGAATRVQHSHVTAGGNGWFGACCPDGAFTGTGRLKVICQ